MSDDETRRLRGETLQLRVAIDVTLGLLACGCVEEAYKYLGRVAASRPVSAEQDVTA